MNAFTLSVSESAFRAGVRLLVRWQQYTIDENFSFGWKNKKFHFNTQSVWFFLPFTRQSTNKRNAKKTHQSHRNMNAFEMEFLSGFANTLHNVTCSSLFYMWLNLSHKLCSLTRSFIHSRLCFCCVLYSVRMSGQRKIFTWTE